MGKWEIVRLGDLASFINGYPFNPNDWSNEGMPIIRIQNLTGSSETTNYFNGSYNSKYVVIKGDILISWSASLGVYEWSKEDALLNQHIFKVVFNKCVINKRFFTYAVRLKLDEMIEATHGSTMKHITKKHFDDILISLPPLLIQQKIADALDKASALIEMRKAQIEKLDLLIKSEFIEMFGDPVTNPKGWEKRSFASFCEIITDGEHATPRRVDNGIYLLSARNVANHKLLLNQVDYIDEEEYTRISKRIVPKKDDILLSCSGSIGRCSRVPLNTRLQLVRSVALLRLKPNLNPVYTEYLITSDYVQNQIDSLANKSSQANLFQGSIRKLIGLVPPLDEQVKFAKFVEQVGAQKNIIEKSLMLLENNYKSLMQKCFSGEMDFYE